MIRRALRIYRVARSQSPRIARAARPGRREPCGAVRQSAPRSARRWTTRGRCATDCRRSRPAGHRRGGCVRRWLPGSRTPGALHSIPGRRRPLGINAGGCSFAARGLHARNHTLTHSLALSKRHSLDLNSGILNLESKQPKQKKFVKEMIINGNFRQWKISSVTEGVVSTFQ